MNLKEISSLSSLAVSSSYSTNKDSVLIRTPYSKQISGLYSDSCYSSSPPTASDYFSTRYSRVACEYQQPCTTIGKKVVLNELQSKALDQRISLRVQKQSTFSRIIKKQKLKAEDETRERFPKRKEINLENFVERFGSFCYAVSQTSISEIQSSTSTYIKF